VGSSDSCSRSLVAERFFGRDEVPVRFRS